MYRVARKTLLVAASACGTLCVGCAGVIQLSPDQQAAMATAQQAADIAAAATQTALTAHAQAAADAQRAAETMSRLAAEAAAQSMPPVPPAR